MAITIESGLSYSARIKGASRDKIDRYQEAQNYLRLENNGIEHMALFYNLSTSYNNIRL
jgi:hypothetical protein